MPAAAGHGWSSVPPGSRAGLHSTEGDGHTLVPSSNTSHIFQPLDVSFFGRQISLVLQQKAVVFKGPEKLLPEGERSETGGG